jgi:hypothetical protein
VRLQALNNGEVDVHFVDKQWHSQRFTLCPSEGQALLDHVLADCLMQRIVQLEVKLDVAADQRDEALKHLRPDLKSVVTPINKLKKLCFMNSKYDAWINGSLNDADVAWFKEEMGLSREDLFRVFARAKDIVQELRPNDELQGLTYDTDVGNWYLYFDSPVPNGHLHVSIYRKDAAGK